MVFYNKFLLSYFGFYFPITVSHAGGRLTGGLHCLRYASWDMGFSVSPCGMGDSICYPMTRRPHAASPVAHTVAHGGLHDPRVGMHLVWACEAARDPE